MCIPSVITTVVVLNWLFLRSEHSNDTEVQSVCVHKHIFCTVPSLETARAAARLDHLSPVTAETSRIRMLNRAPLCWRSVE